MTIQRPTGITILAVLQLIGGVLSLLFGISILFLGGVLFAADIVRDAGTPSTQVGPLIAGFGVVAICNAVAGLLASYGLFTLKGWGWTLAILFSLLNIAQGVIAFTQGSIPSAIISLVISGLILYYLNQSNVKRAFGKL